MMVEVDWSRWRRTRAGYELIPPAGCPRGHRWTLDGPGRPRQRSVTCSCTTARHHLVWVCPACGTYCAEGCTDVDLWAGSTVPAGVGRERRAALAPRREPDTRT
ncbi:hypothetical protein [Pengzhenrongella sicca]|uniref:Uncharacterized protein n=1 Tax=Pengzhenrongella sicca TaxID=2819238 RepID=A0A8A4ZKB0_9MICO|nr:hypothetical protein [Pengzhenrongella sicca]QTE30946.1 hypothetical protein J4E96_08480 [Pengzhenrongella sicca]